MGALIVYMLKAACCLTAFYLFYKVLLARDTFFRFNRMALLSVLVLSFILPAIEISISRPVIVHPQTLSIEMMLLLMQQGTASVNTMPEKTAEWGWSEFIAIAYSAGMVFFLIRFIMAIVRMYRLIHKGIRKDMEDGLHLVIHDDARIAPFSWMNYIILSKADLCSEYASGILEHERAHIRRGHSYDVLLAELCVIVQWFNPAAWLIKRELQNVHEYEADEAVLDKGIDAKQYQLLLIKKAVGSRLYSVVANSINHSSLQKRIAMMLRRKSNPWVCTKYLYILLLAAVAVVTFARPEIAEMSDKVEKMSDVKVAALTTVNKVIAPEKDESTTAPAVKEVITADSVYNTMEEEPEFPGGSKALMNYIHSNLKQPEGVQDSPTRIILQFIVRKDGSVTDVRVAHSANKESEDVNLNAEAVRLIKSMPKWKPGKMGGRAVNCRFFLPVNFGKVSTEKATKSPYEKYFVVVDGKTIAYDELKDFPADKINSMTILRGKQAVAKYGEEAQNGAIEITTKQ